ncbi:hypothetical protein GGQ74_000071 [Desulfobaculum xiamenense]|uniref:Phage tail protein n=1 Tax=Desulfobaculum xiamenense TaxID=995050 RepID=A0A846QDQ0_9BACT|nr:hypothetical protein [Desulfobaculum xiamenense]NJB66431.1 hypothetical protein [Desulfobaculum xiamenense]
MATHCGFPAGRPLPGAPQQTTQALCLWSGVTPGGAPTPRVDSGAAVSAQPTAAVPTTHAGVRGSSFLDALYGHIHIAPVDVDCGNIVAGQSHAVTVWNAHAVPTTCAAIVSSGGDEFRLVGPGAPFTIPPMAEAVYELVVPAEGGAAFTATVEWEFPGATLTLTVTGRRIVVWPWRPQAQIVESLEFLTCLRHARDGSETRSALRVAPRQGFEYVCRLTDAAAQARLDARVWSWRARAWCVPVWWEMRQSAQPVRTGDVAVLVDTACGDFRPDGVAVLWAGDDACEAVMVTEVSPGALALGQAVTGDYPRGCLVLPGRMATMPDDVRHTERGAGVRDTLVRFAVTDNAAIPGHQPEATYEGVAVLTTPPLMQGGTLSRTAHREVDVVDFDTGPALMDSGWHHDLWDCAHRVRAGSPAEVWRLRQLVHHLRGRFGVVWIPTWKDDFILVAPVGVDGVNLRVRAANHAAYRLDPRRAHLAVIDAARGTIIALRRITGVAEGAPGEEIVSLDAGCGRELTPEAVRICYLTQNRLSADRVEITHHRAGVAEAVLAFSGVAS